MSSETLQKKRRVRLSPKDRKEMILDHAAKIIADEGVSVVTMDRLAKEANISKALVYNYFPNLTKLLQILLEREYRDLRRLQYQAAIAANTLEELVRDVTHVYLSYIRERGLLLERLAMEPSVAQSNDPTKYSREEAVEFLARILVENYGIDSETAKTAVDISYGLPAAAGQYLTHHDTDFKRVEDITVIMILGSIEAINVHYKTSLRPIKSLQP